MNRAEIFCLAEKTEGSLKDIFAGIDRVAFANTARVLDAFAKERVSEQSFIATTGYGYDDRGRDTLEAVFADIFGAEKALVRPQFINGTHTIGCALFGQLRTGSTLLCATGMPYDTLCPVIFGDRGGSLKEYGISTVVNSLLEADGSYSEPLFIERLTKIAADVRPTAVLVQRSKGYLVRPSFSPDEIDRICAAVKSVSPDSVIIVDNCYGEFACEREPLISRENGADLLCGSLIKNPGGGIAPTGGYIAGTAEAVENAACRLCVPGIGGEAGSYAYGYREFFQGIFMAPHTTAQAIKTAVFAAGMMSALGFEVSPAANEKRNDIIQTVSFGRPEPLLGFMRGIQSGSPVDSYVTPEPWDMPGYDTPVVMAAGAFVSGASIELSADAPMREPYTAYLQGGLTYESGKLGILKAVAEMFPEGKTV